MHVFRGCLLSGMCFLVWFSINEVHLAVKSRLWAFREVIKCSLCVKLPLPVFHC